MEQVNLHAVWTLLSMDGSDNWECLL